MDSEIRRASNDLIFVVFGKPLPHVWATWATSPSTKFKHVGVLRFEMHKNSYRYQPELIITLENPRYPSVEEQRAPNSGIWRLEICVPLRDAYNFLMDSLPEIHARLSGVR